MDAVLSDPLSGGPEARLAATVERERGALLRFIRRRIADAAEAEDILQDTLYEFVLASRTLPLEKVGAWLRRVARNRIIDRFRRARPRRLAETQPRAEEEGEGAALEDLLPSDDEGPEAQLMREMMLGAIAAALEELPPEQREVFIAHELEGASFKELAQRTGVSVNTLLSRKHYAVRFLRERLQALWDELLTT